MSNWKIINLGDAATFVNGYAFKPSDWSGQGNEIIRIQNLTKSSKEVNYFEGEIAEKYKVVKGDLLISWSATLGVYEWKGEDAWLNQHIFKVVFDKEEFDKNFFKYLISDSLERLAQEVHGATMKHITKKKFDVFQIPLPPLATQKKIAAILDAADAHRQKTKQLLAKYDELAQSIFLDMFGDPVTNPKRWEVKRLGDLGNWKSGGTPSRQNSKYFEGDIPWLSSGELEDMYVKVSKEFISDEALNNSAAKIIDKGSILLGMYDTAALKSTITSFPCACNQAIAFAKLDSKIVNTEFIYTQIQQAKNHFKRLQRGVRQKNLNLSMVKDLRVMVPPIVLQESFAKKMNHILNQRSIITKAETHSINLFNSLLQKAFKGELVNE